MLSVGYNGVFRELGEKTGLKAGGDAGGPRGACRAEPYGDNARSRHGMTTSDAFLRADGEDQKPIHLQGLDRRAAGHRLRARLTTSRRSLAEMC